MLRKIGSSLIHQPSTQYPCTSPQSLHEMNRRFGELKLALGVIGLPVTARDRILRCSPPVVGTTRAGPRFRKVKGPKVVIGGYEFPISLGAENESTSRFDNTFFFFFSWERTAKSIWTVQWRIRGEQSANGARSACGTGTEKNKCGGEAAELIPFASWAQSSAVFPGQIKDLGLLATLLNYINSIFF